MIVSLGFLLSANRWCRMKTKTKGVHEPSPPLPTHECFQRDLHRIINKMKLYFFQQVYNNLCQKAHNITCDNTSCFAYTKVITECNKIWKSLKGFSYLFDLENLCILIEPSYRSLRSLHTHHTDLLMFPCPARDHSLPADTIVK